MMKFITRVFLTLLIIILVISTTALGVLFVIRNNDLTNAQNDLSKTKDDLKTSQDKVASLLGTSSTSSKLKFVDSGLGITVEYPASWTPVANSKVETVTDTTTTTLKSYELKFTKSGSTVTFSRLFGPVGDMAVGYPSSTYDVKTLGTKLIRVANKGTNEWSYKSKVDCADAVDVEAGTETCGSGSFFPGFGTATGSAGFASAEVSDSNFLAEVDAIVLSAAN
ncbi:MAG: hypothetical protein ABI721_02845 [Candidatus Dojkabacteria bacterium]